MYDRLGFLALFIAGIQVTADFGEGRLVNGRGASTDIIEASAKIERLDYGVLVRMEEPQSDVHGTLSLSAALTSRAPSLETILALVAAGQGVPLVPALASARGAIDGRVSLRKIDSSRARRLVRLVSRASFPRRLALERLAEIVRSSASGVLL